MEMEPDEPGRDAGVVGEGGRDGLTHERLGVGAGGVVEPHLQLRQARRRQQQAHGGGERHRACQAAAHPHHPDLDLALPTALYTSEPILIAQPNRWHLFRSMVVIAFIEKHPVCLARMQLAG